MDKVLTELAEIFKGYPTIMRAKLFGSRARGDFKERSDYDVAVYGTVSPAERAKLRDVCVNGLHTLHKVDVIFMQDKLAEEFIDSIENEGITFYDKV